MPHRPRSSVAPLLAAFLAGLLLAQGAAAAVRDHRLARAEAEAAAGLQRQITDLRTSARLLAEPDGRSRP